MTDTNVPPLIPLLTLPPPTPTRAWLTSPHPTLPLLATCHADRTVRIYSLTNGGSLLSTISGGHKRSIRSCAWKPGLNPQTGENVLVTGSFDASVGVWRTWGLGKGKSGDTTGGDGRGGGLASGFGLEQEIGGLHHSAKGENGTGGGEEEEEEEEEWAFALVLDGHDSEVKSVAYSPGGNLLATASRDKSVWIWEEVGEDDYETVAVLQEHEGDVKCVAWHPEEEMLASGSYDDEVRLWREEVDDWGCVGVIRGHESTVWWVAWEPAGVRARVYGEVGEGEGREEWVERRERAGPRLLTASADLTVRVWRRVPRERVVQSKLSIIRSGSSEEEWVQEAVLPRVHTQAVYAVDWGRGGRVVSGGGDGLVVVYEERWAGEGTEWVVVASAVAAHGVFEVNHVVWTKRRGVGRDGKGVGEEEEECVVSTGDDGCVKVWALEV